MTTGLHLAHPWALLALLLLIPYAVLRHRQRRRDAVPFAPLQYRRGPAWRRLLALQVLTLEVALLATVTVGLAGPYRESRLDLFEDEGIDVVLVLDVSLSMLAEDFPPNRLEALRDMAREFVTLAGSNRTGLVIFAKDTFVQTPLTTDRGALLALLDGVTVRMIDQDKSGGTAIGDALLLAGDRLAAAKIEGRDQALVLITDGESNLGFDPAAAARWVRHLGIRLYAIGIGGDEPIQVMIDGEPLGGDAPYLAALDDTQLRAIADASGGRFYRARDVDALAAVFGELARLAVGPLEKRQMTIQEPHAWAFALAALPLFLAGLALTGLVLRRPFR